MKSKFFTVVVDYGMGNISSVIRACEHIGLSVKISSKTEDINNAGLVILPGVGAFKDAIDYLKKLELIEPLKDYIESNRPFLGICLGMQLLLTESEEFGLHKGLDIIKGRVTRLPVKDIENNNIKVPHVGWSRVFSNKSLSGFNPFNNININSYMYFTHSYKVDLCSLENQLSYSIFGGHKFTSGVFKGNTFGLQCHPEISCKDGLEFLKNIKTLAEGYKEEFSG